MQRQIVLAEQSRWEEGQAWMAAEVVNGDLEAEIEGLMHDGGELAGGQGWDGEVDVDEVMGEEMGGYEAFEPLFGSAEAAGMEGMGDQGPAGYVQDMEMISSADPVDHFLDIDMDDFDFDCGFASNAISSNQSLDYTGLRHQA